MNPASKPCRSRSGFSLIEVVVTMGVLLLGLLSMSSTVWRVHDLHGATQERRLAENALRTATEEIQALSARAQADPLTWAATVAATLSAGGAPGTTFRAAGLTPIAGAATAGSIQVVTDETLTDDDLGVRLGMPRDLDGDGLATNTDVTTDGKLLPVIITVQWVGRSSNRTLSHSFFVLGF